MKPTSGSRHEIHLAPMPARINLRTKYARIPADISLYEETRSAFSKTFRLELSARKETDANAATVQLLDPRSAPSHLTRWMANPEGYGILIDRSGIRVWASTGAGYLYGIMTLRQIFRQYGSRIPHMVVGDAPVFERRGVQLSFPQGHTCYRRSYTTGQQKIPASCAIP